MTSRAIEILDAFTTRAGVPDPQIGETDARWERDSNAVHVVEESCGFIRMGVAIRGRAEELGREPMDTFGARALTKTMLRAFSGP